jgi:CO/xanthine dehydrogenase FAD-binding subunit
VDLNTVTSVVSARTRADLAGLNASTAVLAGGSWLFSEPQDHLSGLIDITTLGWEPVTVTEHGLSIAATCTLAEVAATEQQPGWRAHPLFFQCCTALFGSFKVWSVATVGGNICSSLPAGPMTALGCALEADAVIWKADGTDQRLPVADFVTGNATNVLGTGDVLRSIEIGWPALQSQTAYRKIALSPLGRSGAVLVGRLAADGTFVLTITAATSRPVQLRFGALPRLSQLDAAVAEVDQWFTDAHGAADWRRAVGRVLAAEIATELAAGAR